MRVTMPEGWASTSVVTSMTIMAEAPLHAVRTKYGWWVKDAELQWHLLRD